MVFGIVGAIALIFCSLLAGISTFSKLKKKYDSLIQEIKKQEELNLQTKHWNDSLLKNNRELEAQYHFLKQQEQEETINLESLNQNIEQQKKVLLSLTELVEVYREEAENQATEAYQKKFDELVALYETTKASYEEKCNQAAAILNKRLLQQQSELDDIQAKQKAYIDAQKREQEMAEKSDYYSLQLSEYDKSDISLLRDLQLHFTKKDVIDKVIWETYYRPAYDALVGHLFSTSGKTSGIYKITNKQTKQAYIGQSVDIKERLRQHIKTGLSASNVNGANRLYKEIYYKGPENFTFEILEQVTRDKLNERETYWIDFYKTKEVGLNSTKGGA